LFLFSTLAFIKQNNCSDRLSRKDWFYGQRKAKESKSKEQKQIGHFKVTFHIRRGHRETGKKGKIIGWLTSGYFRLPFLCVRIKAKGTCQLKLACYLSNPDFSEDQINSLVW
jgi:hypothetical protein